MAIQIETVSNGVLFNGSLTDKQGWILSASSDQARVVLTNKITGVSATSVVTEVEVDGSTFADYDALVAALGSVLFKNGGGTGAGVQSVNGDAGPDVTLDASDIGAVSESVFSDGTGERPPVQAGFINTSGNFQASANWLSVVDCPCTGGEVWNYSGVRPQTTVLAAVFTKDIEGNVTILIPSTATLQPPYQEQITTPPDAVSISAVARNIGSDVFGFNKNIKVLKNENIEAVSNTKIIKHVAETWKTCGTSITQFDGGTYPGGGEVIGYQTLVKRQITFGGYDNYGLSGHSLAKNPHNNNVITDKMTGWTSGRIWTLELPTNDFKLDVVLGVESDYINDTGNTTFYGALRVWYDRVLELVTSGNPYVVVIIDPQRDHDGYDSWSINVAGHTLEDYNDAMRWFAKRISAPVVDLFREGGINMDTLSYYTYDGLHPNNEGYKLVASGLLDIFMNRMSLG